MRILFLLYSFPVPSQTFILNQIIGLIEQGHEVTILAEHQSEHHITDSWFAAHQLEERTHFINPIPKNMALRVLKAIYLWLKHGWMSHLVLLSSLNFVKFGRHALNLRLFYHAITALNHPDYDIIHCHFGPSGEMGARLREIGALDGILITTFYGYDLYQESCLSKFRNYAFLFEVGDLYIAISETMRVRMEALGCPGDRIITHPLPIHLNRFVQNKGVINNTEPTNIVTIGRFVPKKGIEYGLRAVAQLLDSGMNVRYTLIGDGLLNSKITQLIHELNLESHVELVGWASQTRVIQELQRANILLAASVTAANGDQEGTPMVILEAMAAGVPVVSTHHSGIPDIVEDGVTGLLAPEGDVEALTAALMRLIQHPELRSQMGRAGRNYVESGHNGRLLTQQLEEIYMNLLIHQNAGAYGVGMDG